MATPFNPFAGRGQRAGAQGVQASTGRGRGTNAGYSSTYTPRGTSAPRAGRARGRGRGSSTWTARGRGRGAAQGNAGTQQTGERTKPSEVNSPFAQLNQQKAIASPFGAQSAQASPFSRTPNTTPPPNLSNSSSQPKTVNPFAKPIANTAISRSNINMAPQGGAVPVEDASTLNSYQERYDQLKIDRAAQRQQAINDGQMADPNQPTSLTHAITPVGTCTSMCPEFESVERIVQKMVDKCEKYTHPSTGQQQNMETKMLKRFRRSAAGYDEQLPSDIRTPNTLLQTMNYLMRHVLDGDEPLATVHKFVWDRTRSIRNDFSVQQLTQEADVRIAVTTLERIARFHIVSLHLLSSPANTEPFDRHQEREQLNNTMLSLMYYYDDNRGRVNFQNEAEFRAYYILFSIHDQRPDLEARVQKWPADLLAAPRVQVALDLFAAAGNNWEAQGALDARRPNAIAQGFYSRFFNIINSRSVSYLMACVAEVYFNHIRQTAIRSIWKAYCRTPQSQQAKNDQWTVEELTKVLHFDDDQQTIDFCTAQDLEFAENDQGSVYLHWGDRQVDSVDFAPSSDHSFSETFVESKRAGRNLVAIILGANIREAAIMGMIDRSKLPPRRGHSAMADSNDGELFVSDAGNQIPAPVVDANPFNAFPQSAPETAPPNAFGKSEPPMSTGFPTPSQVPESTSQASNMFSAPSSDGAPSNPFFKPKATDSSPASSPFTSIPQSNPFTSIPQSNPFAKQPEANKTEAFPATTAAAPSPFKSSFSQPTAGETQPSIFANPSGHASPPSTTNPFANASSTFPKTELPKPATTAAAPSPSFSFGSPNISSSPAISPPAVASTSSSMFPSGPSAFTTSSPFSFAKPAASPAPAAAESSLFKPSGSPPAPAASMFSKPSGSTPAATESTLFQQGSSKFAPSTTKNPFEKISSFSSKAPASPFAFPKAPVASQGAEASASPPAASSTLFNSDKPKDASAPSKNPFGFSQASFPAAPSASIISPPSAASPFSFPKAPEASEQPKASDNAAKAEPFSFSPTKSPFPVQDSIFASSKAPEPSQKAEPPAPVAPTLEETPSVFSQPSTSPKASEASAFRSSAPAQAKPATTVPSAHPASQSVPQPAGNSSSSAVPPASQSVSSTRHPAYSPPRTLFEALRQPKIFDAKSSTYSPFPEANTQPLFQDTPSSNAPDNQGSLKRQHSATTTDGSQQHKRRSSLKGSSTSAHSDSSLKRSVHFEEDVRGHELASSNGPKVSSKRNKSKTQEKLAIEEKPEAPTEEQSPSSKLTKTEEHTPFNFSVHKAENRPFPKLPILEKLEKKLAEAKALCEPKPMTEEQLQYVEQERLRRARQVDEDEIALSRARILAEQLKNGPGIFDGWTGPAQEDRSKVDLSHTHRLVEKYRSLPHPNSPKYLPPRLTLIRTPSGRHEVQFAPDTPGRPMSRTERRIRQTGARGLANVPLDFQRRSKGQSGGEREVNGRKNGDGPAPGI